MDACNCSCVVAQREPRDGEVPKKFRKHIYASKEKTRERVALDTEEREGKLNRPNDYW